MWFRRNYIGLPIKKQKVITKPQLMKLDADKFIHSYKHFAVFIISQNKKPA